MAAPRISYRPLEEMDERMQEEMHRCAREGTPRPESSAVRAHAPNAFWAFADSWQAIFRSGCCDHSIKELCRVYISRTVNCEFCGNQRSVKAAAAGLHEMQYDDLLNFESSSRYDERQKAALAYTEAIAWRLDVDDAFWERIHAHFSEPELVELGCFVALTYGQQSWLRLLDIEHHQYLAGSSASMAPGFEDAQRLRSSKASPDYWAAGQHSHEPA
jgi:alkylhydroperoxidase family enzyme